MTAFCRPSKYVWLALAAALTPGCTASLEAVRPVTPPEGEPTLLEWPEYVTSEDRALLLAAERRVADVRQGELLVQVEDRYGVPATGVRASWQQVGHDFGFGVEARFDPVVWGDLLRAGVNRGAARLDWRDTEPDRDTFRTEPSKRAWGLAVLPALGARIRGASAVWLSPASAPGWVMDLRGSDLIDATERHVRGLAERFRGRVSEWEALRESNQDPEVSIELSRASAEAIRAVDPVAPIAITFADPLSEERRISPQAFCQRLRGAGVEYDVVGLELLYNGYTADLSLTPRHSLAEIEAGMDALAGFDRDIHVTAVSVPSAPHPSDSAVTGQWGREWDEELQATYLRALYVLAFSREVVRAVTWRDALDAGSYVYHGGLFHAPGVPKQSFHALQALLRRWKSAGTGEVDDRGRLRLRGFAGTYELELTDERTGRSIVTQARVRERELGELVVTLPDELVHEERDVVDAEW